MKFVSITHNRCRDVVGTTYVWIPDDMTRGELDRLIDLARDAYLAAENYNEGAPPFPGYSPEYDKYPDKLVSEVRAEFNQRKTVYDAWKANKDAKRKNFARHLVEKSDGKIHYYWDNKDIVKADVQWGHLHGITIEYGDSELADQDFNAPKKDDGDSELAD